METDRHRVYLFSVTDDFDYTPTKTPYRKKNRRSRRRRRTRLWKSTERNKIRRGIRNCKPAIHITEADNRGGMVYIIIWYLRVQCDHGFV